MKIVLLFCFRIYLFQHWILSNEKKPTFKRRWRTITPNKTPIRFEHIWFVSDCLLFYRWYAKRNDFKNRRTILQSKRYRWQRWRLVGLIYFGVSRLRSFKTSVFTLPMFIFNFSNCDWSSDLFLANRKWKCLRVIILCEKYFSINPIHTKTLVTWRKLLYLVTK